jgi:hypothetical protein
MYDRKKIVESFSSFFLGVIPLIQLLTTLQNKYFSEQKALIKLA